MSIDSERDLLGLKEVGRIVRAALRAMRAVVQSGKTTAEINEAGATVLARHGARSAPMLVYGFPAETCISVNEEIVHGVPSGRVLEDGDLVKLDVTAEKHGYVADAAISVVVGALGDEQRRLLECVERAFRAAMDAARVGNVVGDIGRAVEGTVTKAGYSVVRELAGHGVGRTIHEPPTVPNFDDPTANQPLTRGLVLAVEPMVVAGSGRIVKSTDGWTISTADGGLAAHHEHTIAITDRAPLLLTAS